MKSYKDLQRSPMSFRGIPKGALSGRAQSDLLFEMHKLAKQAETCQKEIKRLNKQLKEKTSNIKAFKIRFDILKKQMNKITVLFQEERNGKQKKAPVRELAKANDEVDKLDKFFEFDLEY